MWVMLAQVSISHTYPQVTTDIDSLEKIVSSGANSIVRYNAAHQLVAQYIDIDINKALETAEKAGQIALLSNDTFCIVRSQRLKGQVLYRLGRPQESIDFVTPILGYPNLSNFANEYHLILNLLGVCHVSTSQFDVALRYHMLSLEHAEKVQNPIAIARTLGNIGVLYYKLKDYEKALPNLLKSANLRDSLGIPNAMQLMNISLCYTYLNDIERADKYLRMSNKSCGNNCPPHAMVHITYAAGCLAAARNDNSEALNQFKISLNMAKSTNDDRMLLDNLYMLASIELENGNTNEAGQHLQEARAVIELGSPFNLEKIKILGQLAELSFQLHNFQKTADYQRKYIMLRDSIYDESVTTALMSAEADFQERKNQSKIAEQTAIISNKENTIRAQILLNLVVGLLMITTIASLMILFRNYKAKVNVNSLLERKVRERTLELDGAISSLSKELAEKDHRIRRLLVILNDTVGTLKGMSLIAQAEEREKITSQWSSQLGDIITRLSKANEFK